MSRTSLLVSSVENVTASNTTSPPQQTPKTFDGSLNPFALLCSKAIFATMVCTRLSFYWQNDEFGASSAPATDLPWCQTWANCGDFLIQDWIALGIEECPCCICTCSERFQITWPWSAIKTSLNATFSRHDNAVLLSGTNEMCSSVEYSSLLWKEQCQHSDFC